MVEVKQILRYDRIYFLLEDDDKMDYSVDKDQQRNIIGK